MNKNSRPIIGILPDFKEGAVNGYSIKDYYAIRANYVDSINENGGLAILFTYNYDAIDAYLSMIDGLMVIGGNMDISPSRYGENFVHPTVKLNLPRENFEHDVVSKALKTNLPIFGICNGMQLISVLKGGKIIQHIPDHPQLMDHEQSHFAEFKEYGKPYHELKIDKNSQFYKIIGQEKFSANSSHHQAIGDVGEGLKVVATANDGVIEAFENPHHPFCVGVQWHPEYQTCEADKKLFEEFIKQSSSYQKIKNNHG
jgi:putative glutamine amidotransferase